jgi:hypothetical protein
MMDAIHVAALYAQRFTLQGGKRILHGNAKIRILRMFQVIGDITDLCCGCLRLRNA